MRLRLLAVSVAATLPLALAGVASAEDGQFIVDPSQVTAGDVLTVLDDDSDCLPATPLPEGSEPEARIVLLAGEEILDGAAVPISAAEDYLFGAEFDIPADAEPGSYTVAVACFANSETDTPYFEFPDQQFTVLAAPAPPAPSPSVSPSATPTTAAPAPVATPVDRQPTFTG